MQKQKLALFCLLSFIFFLILDSASQSYFNERHKMLQTSKIREELSHIRAELESALTSNLLLIHSVSSYVSSNPDLNDEEFAAFSEELFKKTDVLKNITLAPDMVLKFVFPYDGNSAILGKNYRDIPEQWKDIQKAVKTGEMIVSGPVNLIQGGKGLIGRNPVYVKEKGNTKLWGLASSVIDFDKLINKTAVSAKSVNIDINIAAHGEDGIRNIFGDSRIFHSTKSIKSDINIPNGKWVISALPKENFMQKKPYALPLHILFSSMFLISILIIRYKLNKDARLFESEQRFRDFTQSSSDWVWEVDSNGKYVYTSGNLTEILGYEPSELEGMTPFDLMEPHEAERVSKIFSEAASNKKPVKDLENWNISKTGQRLCFLTNGLPIFNKNGTFKGYRGVDKDITEQKRLMQELRDSHQELELILSTTRDGIAIMDLETNFKYCNNAYLKMTGFSQEEMYSKSCRMMSIPEDIPRAYDAVKHTIENGFLEKFEKTCVVKDGRLIDIRMSMALMPDGKRLLVATSDVTEEKEAQNRISRYVKIVDENVITSQTDINGTITYASKAFCIISGYSKDELIGRNHNVVRHPDMDRSVFHGMWNTIKSGESWRGELKNLKKDGGFYWVDTTISPMKDRFGKTYGYAAVRQDITDKKEVEKLSVTDRLTGIYNRLKLDSVIKEQHLLFERYGTPYSLILFDIDHFKSVNDTYGHLIGDYVLKELAKIISLAVRKTDVLGRWGGEEFLVICPSTDAENAAILAEKLRHSLEQHDFEEVKKITSSFGVAEITPGSNVEELMKNVDGALYNAKKTGRNRVVVFKP